MDWISLEYQVVAALIPPAVVAVLAWLVTMLRSVERDKQVGPWVTRLVEWAEQSIPDKSRRYAQVASMLSGRFPHLHSHEVEVLIESEVHALKVALAQVSVSPATSPADPPAAAVAILSPGSANLPAGTTLSVVPGGQG
jgi:hypothetical protein